MSASVTFQAIEEGKFFKLPGKEKIYLKIATSYSPGGREINAVDKQGRGIEVHPFSPVIEVDKPV